MTFALAGTLVALALVDSTSFGTLLIPMWLMLSPGRVRVARIVVFLATVAVFYLLLGLLLAAGVASFSSEVSDVLDTTAAQVVQAVLGAALVLLGCWIGSRRGERGPGRLLAWRERAVGEDGTVRGLVLLAVTAAAVEAASMVPYLAAIGLIGTAGLPPIGVALVLVGYCAVMVLPALVLLAARVLAARRVEPVLRRVQSWFEATSRENTAWILGIAGVLLAASAAQSLGLVPS